MNVGAALLGGLIWFLSANVFAQAPGSRTDSAWEPDQLGATGMQQPTQVAPTPPADALSGADEEDSSSSGGLDLRIEAGGGYSYVSPDAFSGDNFTPPGFEGSSSGLGLNLQLGLDVALLALGVRATAGFYDSADFWTLGLVAGAHFPLLVGALRLQLEGGLGWLVNAESRVPAVDGLTALALVFGAGAIFDVPIVDPMAVGFGIHWSLFSLSRAATTECVVASDCQFGSFDLARDGSAVGTGLTLDLHLALE